MADFELFNGTNLEEPDSDHRIAMNKPSLAGAFFVRWDNFKNLIRSFTVSKDTDQSISGNKTFTGIVNVQVPTSDNNPVTLKYFNDNVGSEEIIEVATYANLPLVGVISVLYVVLDENVQYRWSGTVYIAMSSPLSYASQAEMEVTPAVENTKVVTPLRAWEGFVFWCKNTLFPELNTSDKTLVGSVNETYELAKNGSAVGGYANNLYFDETASDVVGYETLSYTPPALETTEVWTVNAGEGVKIFQNYLYPSAVSVGFIPAGQWSFQFWGNVSNTAGITKLGATYFKRSALGVETDLLTIWSSEIDNTTPDWIKFSLTLPNFTVDHTDRMGCRVIGQTTHNSDITITYVVGDGYGAWLNNPNRIRHTQLRDFNGDNAVQHIDNSTVKATPIDADKVALWDSVAGKMVTSTIASIKTLFSIIFRLKTEIGDAHGFIAPPNTGNYSISNTGASVTLNLLANAGNYKINGTEYVNAGLSRTFTASLGQNFLCIDSTGLIVSPLDIMSLTKIPCATVTWDGTNAIVGDELHTANRNLIQHKKEHDTDGARYVNGFATTFGAGAANTFSSATGIVLDEERYHTIGARTQAMICYRNVAGTAMLYDAPSANYAKVIGGLPQYDNAGVQTALGANNYGIMWMYVTNNKLPVNSEIVFVQGQASYANIGAAQAAPIPTLNGMSVAEWKLAFRVIIRQVANALVFVQADDYRRVAGGLAVNGGGLTSINAANVICTAPTGYTATDQQSLDNDLAANTIKGATATHATIVAADTIGVWDSVGNVFKKASALAFKTYVKLGLVASEVGVTASVGYPATDQQSYNTNNAARVVKLESNETPASIADTDNVRFKSGTGYYVRTLLAIKNYVKLGLNASEVVNDSTNMTGANLKLVLDNATLAIDGVTIQDGDLFPIAREVEAPAGVFTSVNMYHTWDRIKDEIKDTCGTYYIDSFDEFKTIVEDPLTPSDSITFYLSNDNVFIMVGTITCHTENIYVKSQNSSVYLATLTINTTLIDTPNRIYFDGVCRIGDTEITITIPSETTTLFIKELAGDELYPSSLNILKSGAGYLQYNNATNISRSFLTSFDQYQAWDAIRQDEKWAYSHYRAGGGLDTVGKTIAKVTGKSDAYGNFSIKVRYRLCYNETDLVLPLFPATLPHGKWVRFETCDYCRDKARGEGGIFVTPRGFEVAKFYKGDSDLVITYGSLSNEAGAGGIYENQYDDNNTYFYALVRSTLAQSTFKVKYTDSVSVEDNDTWVIVHLRGVIL